MNAAPCSSVGSVTSPAAPLRPSRSQSTMVEPDIQPPKAFEALDCPPVCAVAHGCRDGVMVSKAAEDSVARTGAAICVMHCGGALICCLVKNSDD